MAAVLVADDEPDIRIVLQRLLTRAGHAITTAADGRAALEHARTQHPDLILTDHDMPHMTGLQLCNAVGEDPDLRHTPVIIISGRLRPDDPCLNTAKPAAVLTKPFVGRDLIALIADLLDRHDTTGIGIGIGSTR